MNMMEIRQHLIDNDIVAVPYQGKHMEDGEVARVIVPLNADAEWPTIWVQSWNQYSGPYTVTRFYRPGHESSRAIIEADDLDAILAAVRSAMAETDET